MLKNLYYNTRDYILNLNLKKDKRPIIFLICLLIATALWFSNALGKRYETTVSMPIQYTNMPENKALVKTPPTSIKVKMDAYGYTLLRHKINLTINPINFNFASFTNQKSLSEGLNTYKIASNRYLSHFSKQVSSEISILEISPDTLYFEFDDIVTRQVPVNARVELDFENQYFLSDSIRSTPEFIEISGPQSLIDTIGYVETKSIRFKNLNTTVKQSISLIDIPGVSLSDKRVELEIPVSLYTEYTSKIRIQKLNLPDSLNLVTFPGFVNITCIVAFDKFAGMNASAFSLAVDYTDIKPDTKRLPIKLLNQPSHIKSLNISPQEVEFIIENQ